MVDDNKATAKKAPAKKTATKRKVLTSTERIAKLEAELAAVRQKGVDRDRKGEAKLEAQLESLVEKRDALDDRIAEVEAELKAVRKRVASVESGDADAVEASDNATEGDS